MAKKKKRSKSSSEKSAPQMPNTMNAEGAIILGDIDMGENATLVGRDQIEITNTNSYIQKEFKEIYKQINHRPETSKTEREFIKSTVEEVEIEAQKGEEADAGFLAKRLENLKNMAPDILEVVIATLGNPAAGLSLVMKKIQAKIEEENSGA